MIENISILYKVKILIMSWLMTSCSVVFTNICEKHATVIFKLSW